LRLIATQLLGEIWRVPYRVASPEFAMSNRTATFVFAVFASVLAGAALATLSSVTARADDCLSAPRDATPEGGHWYYRIEHATKRHCWHLQQEDEQQTRSTASNPSLAAKPEPPRTEGATPRSLSDAYAEWPRRTGVAPETNGNALVPATRPATASDGDAPDARPPQSLFASRWPETSGVAAAGQQPATIELAANLPSNAAAAIAPAAAAAAPLAIADTSRGRTSSAPSVAMLLGVATGALALAGITAAVVFKLGGARRRSRQRPDRIWQRIDDEGMGRSDHPAPDVVPRRTGLPRDLDQPADADLDDASERIAEFIAQLSRRAPT
jgi:hypothetical protein